MKPAPGHNYRSKAVLGYNSTGMGALLVSLKALWPTLVDRNPFRPC